jgi:hypothetical protein
LRFMCCQPKKRSSLAEEIRRSELKLLTTWEHKNTIV